MADIGSKLATAALYLIVARKTGPSEFGIFAFAISFAGIAVMLGQFGQEFVLVREVARDRTKLDAYYSNVMLSRLMLGVPPLLIALGVASLAGMSAHTRLVILLMGFGFLGDYMIQVSFAVFQAYERVGFLPVVLITQRWVTTSVAIALLYAGGGSSLSPPSTARERAWQPCWRRGCSTAKSYVLASDWKSVERSM